MKITTHILTRLETARAKIQSLNPPMRVLYACSSLGLVGGSIYNLYYGIFLYKHTFSLSVLAMDGLLGGLGTWLGYVLSVQLMRKYGYNRCIRLAFALWTTIAVGTAFIAGHIAEWYLPLALLKGLPGGIYGAVGDAVMLSEVKTKARRGFFQANLVIEFLASIILPSAVGGLIAFTGGYTWAFIVAGAIYSIGAFLPWKLPKRNLSLDLHGIKRMIRRPLYPLHALNRMSANGFNQLNGFALTIIPFLLLKNELSVGMFTSLSALAAAACALLSRRIKSHRALRLGLGAHAVRTVSAIAFATAWTAPFMVAWQMIGKVLTPLHDPVQQSLDIHNDSLVLGEDYRSQALQINLLNNTLNLIGTTIAFGTFICITRTSIDQQRSILVTLVITYAVWRLVNLTASAFINKWANDAENYIPLARRLTLLFRPFRRPAALDAE